MDNERWIKWYPTVNIPTGDYELINLNLNLEGLTIILSDNEHELVLFFEDSIFFSQSNEFYRLNLYETGTESELTSDWRFYKVEHSQLKKWFVKQYSNIMDESEFIQFTLYLPNDIVDIFAYKEPVMTVKRLTI